VSEDDIDVVGAGVGPLTTMSTASTIRVRSLVWLCKVARRGVIAVGGTETEVIGQCPPDHACRSEKRLARPVN